MMNKKGMNITFRKKKEFHKRKANLPFEEKVKEIIALQKIDTEFSSIRKTPRAKYMKVWKID